MGVRIHLSQKLGGTVIHRISHQLQLAMNNFAMMNQAAQYSQAGKSQAEMNQMFAMNPALLYQNQFNLYQALQDPATVALLIQQQQALQQQLQAQQAAHVQSAAIGREAMGLWAQRSQQLFGPTGKNLNKREGRNKSCYYRSCRILLQQRKLGKRSLPLETNLPEI